MTEHRKTIILLSLVIILQGLTMFFIVRGRKALLQDVKDLNEDLDQVYNDYYNN